MEGPHISDVESLFGDDSELEDGADMLKAELSFALGEEAARGPASGTTAVEMWTEVVFWPWHQGFDDRLTNRKFYGHGVYFTPRQQLPMRVTSWKRRPAPSNLRKQSILLLILS